MNQVKGASDANPAQDERVCFSTPIELTEAWISCFMLTIFPLSSWPQWGTTKAAEFLPSHTQHHI